VRLTAAEMCNRVLVCSGERPIVRLIQLNLERVGRVVNVAFDGSDAVELLKDSQFDRVIRDAMMPGMDGFEVIKWIRKHDHTKHLRVSLMIAQSQRQEIYDRHPCQADRYIVKPFNPMDHLAWPHHSA